MPNDERRPVATPLRVALLAAVLGALGLFLAYQAFLSPTIEFLRPSFSGDWVVHSSASARRPRAFFQAFQYDEPPPASLKIRVTAMRAFHAEINGYVLPVPPTKNWKNSLGYDIGPHLKEGMNLFRVNVTNREGPAALLVEGPPVIRSGSNWKMARSVKWWAQPKNALLAGQDELFLRDQPNILRRSAYFPVLQVVTVAYFLVVLYGLLSAGRAIRPTDDAAAHPLPAQGFRQRHGFFLLVLLVVGGVQISNAIRFNPHHGLFDTWGHVAYIRYVAETWLTPLAEQGWEMFQPPLFYFCAATLYAPLATFGAPGLALKAIQAMNALAGLSVLLATWLTLYQLFPTRPTARHLGLAVAAFLPMSFYMSPLISNEPFAGAVIAWSTYLAVRVFASPRDRRQDAALLGLACGLGLLAKATGLFLFLAVTLAACLRALTQPRAWKWAAVFIAVVLLTGGWFYLRNAWVYDNPFIGNWDHASGYHYEQEPGCRTLNFYTTFGPFLSQEIGRSRYSGFWEGNYASLWGDPHSSFKPGRGRVGQASVHLVLWLALAPTLCMVFGFARAMLHLLRREWDHPYLILVATTCFALTGVVSFTMEAPFFSTIKAFFLLSLVPAVGVFSGLGLEQAAQGLGRMRWLLYANLALLAGAVLCLFAY